MLLNININQQKLDLKPKNGGSAEKKKGKSKSRQQQSIQGQTGLPQRPGAKIIQENYAKYVDGPTNLPEVEGVQGKKKQSKILGAKGGNRPVRSAVRNNAKTQIETGDSRPQVIMQSFMDGPQ